MFGTLMVTNGTAYPILRKLGGIQAGDPQISLPDKMELIRQKVTQGLNRTHERAEKANNTRSKLVTFLTEWMSGLCRSINIDEECIQQPWIQLLSMPQAYLQEQETIEQEIGRRTRNQKNDRSLLLQVQEQLIRTQGQIFRIQENQQRVGRRMNRLTRKLARRSPHLGILAREDIILVLRKP